MKVSAPAWMTDRYVRLREVLEVVGENDWHQLVHFADNVHQMIDGRLVARRRSDGSEAVLAIEFFDSSKWIVEAGDHEKALAAAERVASSGR